MTQKLFKKNEQLWWWCKPGASMSGPHSRGQNLSLVPPPPPPPLLTVVNCFLLKCRKLRREDQDTSDSIVGFFIEKPQADGSCSHRNLILSNFYRVSYRQNWKRDFLRLRQNIKESKHLREALTKVESLSSLTH